MSDEQTEILNDLHERDQEDAAIFDVSKSVARHYRTLRAEGMGESSAVELCQSFQFSLMGGSDATLTVVGMGEDE